MITTATRARFVTSLVLIFPSGDVVVDDEVIQQARDQRCSLRGHPLHLPVMIRGTQRTGLRDVGQLGFQH